MYCYHHNLTSQIQRLRIASADRQLEKIVFPNQRIIFTAFPNAVLEIYGGGKVNPGCAQVIACKQLRVQEAETSNMIVA